MLWRLARFKTSNSVTNDSEHRASHCNASPSRDIPPRLELPSRDLIFDGSNPLPSKRELAKDGGRVVTAFVSGGTTTFDCQRFGSANLSVPSLAGTDVIRLRASIRLTTQRVVKRNGRGSPRNLPTKSGFAGMTGFEPTVRLPRRQGNHQPPRNVRN